MSTFNCWDCERREFSETVSVPSVEALHAARLMNERIYAMQLSTRAEEAIALIITEAYANRADTQEARR